MVLLAQPALAQVPAPEPTVDARLAGPLIRAQRAEIELRDAVIKVMQDDMSRREREWAEYASPLYAPKPERKEEGR